jgi:hypothetical protein
VEVRRRTEAGDAPGEQGAMPENTVCPAYPFDSGTPNR